MNTYHIHRRIAACLLIFATAAPATFGDETSSKETSFLAVLTSDAANAQKAMACKNLAIYGSDAAVPELSKLLPDPQLSSWARIALEAIPGEASNKALRDAAGSLQGDLLIGVINSIGIRRDVDAVELMTTQLANDDAATASAAAIALGRIGNEECTKQLRAALATSTKDVRSAVAEGCVLCAERLLAADDAATAVAIYDELRNADLPMQRIIEGTRGAILARGDDGIPLLMEAFQSDNKKMFQLALGTVRDFPGSAVDKALATEMMKAPPQKAALIVQAMADRSETVDRAVVLKAAETGDTAVRLSAINALQRVGNSLCLPTLLDIAVGDDQELAAAAQETLAVLPGRSVDGEIGVLLPTAAGQRERLLLKLIGQRRVVGETSTVESALENSDDAAIRSAALVALGEIVTLKKLPVLISQAIKPSHPEDAAIAQKALKAASVRMPDKEACAALLTDSMKRAPSAAKLVLLEILYSVGGKTALQTLAASAVDRDVQLQDASSRLLGKWNGIEAAPVLLNLATKAPSEKFRVRALRGYIGIARKFTMPNKQRAEMCQSAINATRRPTEHRLALDVLKLHPSPAGLQVAVAMTKRPELKSDASAAVLVIAQKVGSKGVDVSRMLAGVGLDKVNLKITKAEYGAAARKKNVTSILQKQAGDLPLVTLASGTYNASFGGDPAPGVAKQLTVEYTINGKAGSASFNENALIILPIPN